MNQMTEQDVSTQSVTRLLTRVFLVASITAAIGSVAAAALLRTPAVPLLTCASLPDISQDASAGVATAALRTELADATTNVRQRHQEYRTSLWKSGNMVRSLQKAVEERKKILWDVAERDPNAALTSLLSTDEQQALTAFTKNCLETPTNVEGVFAQFHTDLDQGTGEDRYSVRVSEEHYVTVLPARADPTARAGDHVRITGLGLDDRILYDASPSSLLGAGEIIEPNAITPVLGQHKTIVLLAYFNGQTQPAFNLADVQNFYNTTVVNYFKEVSYNATTIVPTVRGWFYLSGRNAQCGTLGNVTYDAMKMAQQADPTLDFTQYQSVVTVAPFGSCGWSGKAPIGTTLIKIPRVGDTDLWLDYRTSWIMSSSTVKLKTIGHEIGHTYGNQHSAFMNCGATSFGTGCPEIEYGDWFSIMGGFFYDYSESHMHTYEKTVPGWLTSNSIATFSGSGPTSFTLKPAESAAAGIKAVKVPLNGTETLYIEYRQPIGFDTVYGTGNAVYSGALVHYVSTAREWTYLLDTTPPTAQSDPTVRVGQTFTMPGTSVRIKTLSLNSSQMVVEVSSGTPDSTPPTVSLTTPTSGATVSTTTAFRATATDASGIGKIEFYVDGAMVATDLTAPYEVTWDPGTLRGQHVVGVKATDTAGNTSAMSSVTIQIPTTNPALPPRDIKFEG